MSSVCDGNCLTYDVCQPLLCSPCRWQAYYIVRPCCRTASPCRNRAKDVNNNSTLTGVLQRAGKVPVNPKYLRSSTRQNSPQSHSKCMHLDRNGWIVTSPIVQSSHIRLLSLTGKKGKHAQMYSVFPLVPDSRTVMSQEQQKIDKYLRQINHKVGHVSSYIYI